VYHTVYSVECVTAILRYITHDVALDNKAPFVAPDPTQLN